MTLYDATNPGNLPPGADVAGYDDGRYADWGALVARYGDHARLAVTVFASDNEGNCLDVETGDARPVDAPGWVQRRRATGLASVWLYCNLSTWPDVVAALRAAGIDPAGILWWVADYTNAPHFPTFGGLTAAACQYAGGITARFDTSCVRPGVFGPPPAPPTVTASAPPPPTTTSPPHPIPGQEPAMLIDFSTTTGADGTAYVAVTIPPGCTKLVGGWVDVLDPDANPAAPAHDGDIAANPHGGVVCQPAVGAAAGQLPAGVQRLRIAGAIPSHFYTGHAMCA